jgi:hypothetical protein
MSNMPSTTTVLLVNGKTIELDKFTKSFIASTVLGMFSTLRGLEKPEELESVKVVICGQEASILADGVEIAINGFIRDFVRNTVKAMVGPLRGVDAGINTVEITLLLPLTNQL